MAHPPGDNPAAEPSSVEAPSPLDTAEAAVNLGQSLLKRELLVANGGSLQHGQVPSWTGLGFDMRQRCIELMDAALLCAISDKYAREARAEEEAQKHITSLYQKSCTCARRNATAASVAALCRDKAALGSVYDSIVAKISRAHAAAQPGAGVAAAAAAGPASAADQPQPMQHDGAPPQNGPLQGDQQQLHGQNGLQAANGVRLRPGDIRAPPPPPPLPESLQPPGAASAPAETDLSAGSDAAEPAAAALDVASPGIEAQAAATLSSLADMALPGQNGAAAQPTPLLPNGLEAPKPRQSRTTRRAAGQLQLPFRQVLLIQTGTGQDQHGTDATTAAVRACRDASQSSSLPALRKLVPNGYHGLKLSVRIGVPDPKTVDASEVKQVFPHGRVAVEVVDGGLRAPEVTENGEQRRGDWRIAIATVTIGY